MGLIIVMILAIIICVIVILVSALTTSKAYQYKHKVDPLEGNPHIQNMKTDEQDKEK